MMPAARLTEGRHHMFIETTLCAGNSAGVVQSPPVIPIYKHLTPRGHSCHFHDSIYKHSNPLDLKIGMRIFNH